METLLEKPISLFNRGQSFQVPTHSGCHKCSLARSVFHHNHGPGQKMILSYCFSGKDSSVTKIPVVYSVAALIDMFIGDISGRLWCPYSRWHANE